MSEMKRLVFGEGLMIPTITGEKKITLRKYRVGSHDFKKGEIIRGQFQDGLNILLRITADTEIMSFLLLKDSVAREGGFKNKRDAFNGLCFFYPELNTSDRCAVIRYEVCTIDDAPVVSVNQANF